LDGKIKAVSQKNIVGKKFRPGAWRQAAAQRKTKKTKKKKIMQRKQQPE